MSQRKERERQEERIMNKADEVVIASESFLIKYRNPLLIGLGVIVAIIAIYFAYQTLYLEPKTKEAQAALYKGEMYFLSGQDTLALFGDGNSYPGFEAIINDYSATKTGDLAKAYAGLTYARMGDSGKALSYLKDFSGGDLMITPAVKGAIGDCLVNTGKAEEAVSYFEKTAKEADDVLLSPIFYKKAAIVYRDLKKYDKVIEMFTLIKNNYISSPEAMEADKYIQEATLLKTAN